MQRLSLIHILQHPANDMTTDTVTTHFDYHSIDHNLLKLDILGHDDPTMIRMLEDLTGVDAKTIPLDDPEVMSLFQSTEALGVDVYKRQIWQLVLSSAVRSRHLLCSAWSKPLTLYRIK